MRTALSLVALLVFSVSATADDPPARSASSERPREFEVAFTDGSKVRVVLLEPAVTLATRYGKLTVPVEELLRIDPGFRYPEGIETRVEDAIARLGSPSFRDRETAEKTLVGFKEFAVPALRRAAKGADPEQVRRAEAVLAKLAATLPEDRLELKDTDTVKTVEFTVRGRLELTSLKVRSRQFGEASLRLDQLKSIKSLFVGNMVADLSLDAGKYARQGWTTWMDTGLDVSTDARLEISASGMIDQWVQSPGQYMAGPNGTAATAPGTPAPGAMPGAPIGKGGGPPGGVPPGVIRGWMSGSVIGKIGAGGVPFVVGANYKELRAPAKGRLFLIIAPSNWNNDSVGSYKVRVRVGD